MFRSDDEGPARTTLSYRGRGAADNPQNRFLPIAVERDAWTLADDPGPDTVLLRDSSRSILSTNDSPDVGFDVSLNPYRGCEHGCAYCMSGDTPILMGAGTTRKLALVRPGDEIYGTVRKGFYRRYVKTVVHDHWEVAKPAFRITLENGTTLVASGDHRFLTERGWKFVTDTQQGSNRRPHLTENSSLMGVGGLGQRFFHEVDPAMKRKRSIAERALKSSSRLGVVSIEPIGTRSLFDISTGTGDFIANGVVSHNCYARPTHEYLGFSAGLDFESKLLVKEAAAELLRDALARKSWTPQPIALSGVTDAYQPVERRLGITRACLEVLAEFRNPVVVVTKSHLVTRDSDLLAELARHGAAAVRLSVTTLDRELARRMEPRAATPERRLDAIGKLAEAGIPTGVMVGPVIPGLTDHELPSILEAASDAGATTASYIMLRLPHGVKELFSDWLERNYPNRKQKVLGRIREIRSGRLNDPEFGSRMRGEGPYAEQVRKMFEVARRRYGLDRSSEPLSTEAFRRPAPGGQGDLFGGSRPQSST